MLLSNIPLGDTGLEGESNLVFAMLVAPDVSIRSADLSTDPLVSNEHRSIEQRRERVYELVL